MNRKVKMGMIGGGEGSFIGAVHRIAANLDGQIELVCGAFSSSSEKSKKSGEALFLPSERVYGSYEEMITSEKLLPEGERMDIVSIVTPNHMHYDPAKMALENGFHVICDKPVAFSLEEAKNLEIAVKNSGLLFALTHNYTGYPMVKQAKAMIEDGKLGKIRKIIAEYPQGWLATDVENNKQADWRTDPKRAGISCCIGDIGTHAENLTEYITGLKIKEISADLTAFVEGRVLDDDGSILLRFEGGAKGVLFASQISVGEENELKIRIYGEKGGVEWLQSEPNSLIVKWLDRPKEIYRTGAKIDHLYPQVKAATRLPEGHPEGYLEAFANIYVNFCQAVRAFQQGTSIENIEIDFPTINDGVRGMKFIQAAVDSSNANSAWLNFDDI